MLQALKLDSSSRSAGTRDREAGTDLQESAFAGYLASSAANFAKLTVPTPAPTPKSAPRQDSETRTEANRAETRPSLARQISSESEARAERNRADDRTRKDRVEDARPKPQTRTPDKPQKSEDAPESRESAMNAGTPDQPKANPTDSAQTEVAESGSAIPAANDSPAISKAIADAAATATRTEGVLPQALVTPANQPPAPDPQSLIKVTPQKAVETPGSMQVAATTIQTALDQTTPGVHQRTQTPGNTPTNLTSKPALSELLSFPKPEMEVPKPLANAGRTEGTTGKETPVLPLQVPLSAAEQLAQALPTGMAPMPLGHEAILASSVKTEPTIEKASANSGFSIAVGGPSSPVRGTTPVSAVESAQSAKGNPTFTQMDSSIRWLINNQAKGAEIQMNPESLGRVVIKLRMEGSEVHAQLWASEGSTVPILQDQKAALEASLRQQGLTLGSFDLQQGRRGDDTPTSNATPSESGVRIAGSLEKKQDLPTVPPALLGGARLLEVFA